MPTTWPQAGLAEAGFVGFVPFAELPLVHVPTAAGVYVVVRPDSPTPVLLKHSPAGWFKGKEALRT